MMNILLAIDFENLHTLLRSLYDEMMPLCANIEQHSAISCFMQGVIYTFFILYDLDI